MPKSRRNGCSLNHVPFLEESGSNQFDTFAGSQPFLCCIDTLQPPPGGPLPCFFSSWWMMSCIYSLQCSSGVCSFRPRWPSSREAAAEGVSLASLDGRLQTRKVLLNRGVACELQAPQALSMSSTSTPEPVGAGARQTSPLVSCGAVILNNYSRVACTTATTPTA